MVDHYLPAAEPPTVSTPVPSSAPTGRDTSIDVLRGCFIISMTTAHLAAGSFAYKVSHAAVWLDGAIGFVTLSGLVLGVVYRRRVERSGRVSYGKALRRAHLLYLIQLLTLVLALAVSAASTRDLAVDRPEQIGGWPSALGMVATMRLPARYLDVLPMYVVLLLAAVPALVLLSRSHTRTLLGIAGAVYVLATAFPQYAVLPGVHFNWAAWQLPFMIGLTVGWHWDARAIPSRLRSRVGFALAGAVAVSCFAAAQAFGRFGAFEGSTVDSLVTAAFAKFNLGPAHVLFGLAAIALGYSILSLLDDAGRFTRARTWLSLLGSRSLDAFVILCVAVIVLPAVLRYESSSSTAMGLVVLVVAAQTGWVLMRRRGYVPGVATGTSVPPRPLPWRSRGRRILEVG